MPPWLFVAWYLLDPTWRYLDLRCTLTTGIQSARSQSGSLTFTLRCSFGGRRSGVHVWRPDLRALEKYECAAKNWTAPLRHSESKRKAERRKWARDAQVDTLHHVLAWERWLCLRYRLGSEKSRLPFQRQKECIAHVFRKPHRFCFDCTS